MAKLKSCIKCGVAHSRMNDFCKPCDEKRLIHASKGVQVIKTCSLCSGSHSRFGDICKECERKVTYRSEISVANKASSQFVPSVKHCRNCGSPSSGQDEVCLNCGFLPLTRQFFCQECGNKTDEGQVLCLSCGFNLQYQPLK